MISRFLWLQLSLACSYQVSINCISNIVSKTILIVITRTSIHQLQPELINWLLLIPSWLIIHILFNCRSFSTLKIAISKLAIHLCCQRHVVNIDRLTLSTFIMFASTHHHLFHILLVTFDSPLILELIESKWRSSCISSSSFVVTPWYFMFWWWNYAHFAWHFDNWSCIWIT